MQYKLPRSFYVIIFIAFAVANVSVYRAILAPHVLTVDILKVGPASKESNAVLVRSPNGKTTLIDTGPDASILRALGDKLPMWQRNIDAVILTSAAARSAGGLSIVQSRYHVSKIIRIGGSDTPYGSSFLLDSSRLHILAPATVTISYGSSIFSISSSTPAGTYTSDGSSIK